MDPKTVRKLEEKLEKAIARTLDELGKKRLPKMPSQHTRHLMAKAAVAVLEATLEEQPAQE